MGRDLYGFVELRFGSKMSWHTSFNLKFLRRNNGFFFTLADFRDDGFPSICHNRGMPEDASKETVHSFEKENQDYPIRWGTWEDFEKYDWQQELTSRIGTLTWFNSNWKACWEQEGQYWVQKWHGKTDPDLHNIPLLAKDTISPDVQIMLDHMKTAAQQLGPHNVRIICWIDH